MLSGTKQRHGSTSCIVFRSETELSVLVSKKQDILWQSTSHNAVSLLHRETSATIEDVATIT